jgi:hypothetical protein
MVAIWGLFMLALIGGVILLLVLYLLNLQRLLKEISTTNRLVAPGNVWLMFIPLFNLIYPFILYPRICDSVRNEYQSRGMSEADDFGRAIGITMPVLGLCGWLPYIRCNCRNSKFSIVHYFLGENGRL